MESSVEKWTDMVTQAKAVVGRIKMRLMTHEEKYEAIKENLRYLTAIYL